MESDNQETRTFLFSWDMYGIESIVDFDYDTFNQDNIVRKLKGESVEPDPFSEIIFSLKIRAMTNMHRCYEIFAIKCDSSMDEKFWKKQWNDHPQVTADLIREKGFRIFPENRPSYTLPIRIK